MSTTAQSEVGALRRVALRHARHAFGSQHEVDQQWKALNYSGAPDFIAAQKEYDEFAKIIESASVAIEWIDAGTDLGMDSLYVRDAAVVCDRGVIVGRMGKQARRGEPRALGRAMTALGIPVCGRIEAPGCVEGGDVVWLDARTIAVGEGYRTNAAGIRQLAGLLGDDIRVITVPLPHWRGPDDVFHLMSILSPLDTDLAVVYSPLLPVPFRQYLLGRGVELVETAPAEFESMGCNVLALAPRRCLMLDGNAVTQRRLEAAGVEVLAYRGEEISRKGAGGPTCLTRPIARDAP